MLISPLALVADLEATAANAGTPGLAAPTIITPANGSVLGTPWPIFSGQGTPVATLHLSIDLVEQGSVGIDAIGNWSKVASQPLTDGPHSASARAEMQGQWSDPTTIVFTVDTTPPAAPVVLSPVNAGIVDTPRPPLVGTSEALSSVTVILDGQPLAMIQADASGTWGILPSSDLAEGPHTLSARAQDAVGNVSPNSTANVFTVQLNPELFKNSFE